MTNPFMPLLVGPNGTVNEEALALALRAEIENLELLTEAVSVASRYNTKIPLLADELMNRTVGLAQAAWLVDLETSYKMAYSGFGRKRLAWAIDMEKNKNKNHENDDELCEGKS